MVYIAQTTASNIRKDLFKNIQKLPLKYFDTHSSGDIMSRLTNDVDNINTTLSQSVTQFFSGIINVAGMFIAMLSYKLEEQGKKLIRVDKFYPSSKTCSCCGYIHKELKLSDRIYECPQCGMKLDRDYNASLNIRNEGMRLASIH